MPATVWRGRIAFGMVSIPVRLHKAARRERIRFHNVYRTEASVSAVAETFEDESEVSAPDGGPADEPVMSDRHGGAPEASPSSLGTSEQIVRVHNAPVSGSNAAPILKGYELEEDQYVVLEPKEIAALRPKTSTELSIMEFVLLEEIDLMMELNLFNPLYQVMIPPPLRGKERSLHGFLGNTSK